MYAGAALAIVGGIFSLVTIEQGIQLGLNSSNTRLSGREYETAASVARAIAYAGVLFSIVVGTALWIWMALANNAGKNWARIVATGFAGIGIVSQLISVVSSGANHTLIVGSLIFGILTLIVSIAALTLMWLKPSSEYYKFKSQKVVY